MLRKRVSAFTLVEVLVSTAIISLIMLVLVSIIDQTSRTWRYTNEKIEKFQDARDGFESMTRKLSQATLNTYWEYLGVVYQGNQTLSPRDKNIGTTAYKNFIPLQYGRMSELRFLCGPMSGSSAIVEAGEGDRPFHGVFFQAPFGISDSDDDEEKALNNLLNTWGYFLEVSEKENKPSFLTDKISPPRWRSRLMEYSQPTENMVLNDTSYNDKTSTWLSTSLNSSNPPTRMLAENVIALIITPKLSKQDEDYRKSKSGYFPYVSPNYVYDSTLTINPGATAGTTATDGGGINPKNQLPPIVQVTMVAIDERSAQRFVDRYGKDKSSKPYTIGPRPGTAFTTNSQNLETPQTGDLALYEKAIIDMGLTYRIFSTNVSIKAAKWSRAQTN